MKWLVGGIVVELAGLLVAWYRRRAERQSREDWNGYFRAKMRGPQYRGRG